MLTKFCRKKSLSRRLRKLTRRLNSSATPLGVAAATEELVETEAACVEESTAAASGAATEVAEAGTTRDQTLIMRMAPETREEAHTTK